jgi:hypothetical protein
MTHSLDLISTNTAAPMALPSVGSGKTDSATASENIKPDNQFVGLLKQALKGQQTAAQSSVDDTQGKAQPLETANIPNPQDAVNNPDPSQAKLVANEAETGDVKTSEAKADETEVLSALTVTPLINSPVIDSSKAQTPAVKDGLTDPTSQDQVSRNQDKKAPDTPVQSQDMLAMALLTQPLPVAAQISTLISEPHTAAPESGMGHAATPVLNAVSAGPAKIASPALTAEPATLKNSLPTLTATGLTEASLFQKLTTAPLSPVISGNETAIPLEQPSTSLPMMTSQANALSIPLTAQTGTALSGDGQAAKQTPVLADPLLGTAQPVLQTATPIAGQDLNLQSTTSKTSSADAVPSFSNSAVSPITAEAQDIAVLPGVEIKQSNPISLEQPQNLPTAAPNLAKSPTDSLESAVSAAFPNLPIPSLNGQPAQSASTAVEGLETTVGKPLDAAAIALSQMASQKLVSTKPNASVPGTDAFKKLWGNVSAQLSAMRGEIEAAPKLKGSDKFAQGLSNEEAESVDSSTSTELGNLSGITLTLGDTTGAGTVDIPANKSNADGIQSFSSLAQNPTDQIAEGTAYSVKNGHKELIIRLNPDNLGEVRVNLTSHGNQELSARLIASTPESHELLKGQLDSLKSTLEAQGVTVDRLSVVLAGAETANGNNAGSKHQSQQEFQGQQSQTGQQQSSFQQQSHPQNPFHAGLFNNLNQGHAPYQGFAQQRANGTPVGSNGEVETGSPAAPTEKPDNGRISILA